jgi:hypothetical protein
MKKVPMKTLSIVMETESPIHTVLPMMAIAAILRRQVIAMTRGPKVSCHIRQLARNLARVPAAGVLVPAVPIHTASIVTGMEFPIHTALTELEITASLRQRITAQTLGPTVHRPLAKRGRAHVFPTGAVMLALYMTTPPIVMETELPTHVAPILVPMAFLCHRINVGTLGPTVQNRTRVRKFRSCKMGILRKVMLARLTIT